MCLWQGKAASVLPMWFWFHTGWGRELGGRWGVLPLLSARAAQGDSEQPFLSVWHLPMCHPWGGSSSFAVHGSSQSHPMLDTFCALRKWTLTGRVCSSFTFSSQPIYQPGHFWPHTRKRLWMKAPLCCRLQGVHGILRLSHVLPILFWILLKFLKEWVLTQCWYCWDQCLVFKELQYHGIYNNWSLSSCHITWEERWKIPLESCCFSLKI